jgi:Conjugative transposon protein TcpC
MDDRCELLVGRISVPVWVHLHGVKDTRSVLPPNDTTEVPFSPRWSLQTLRRGAAPADARFDAKPDRPSLQLVVRAGLWVALAIGCVGGIVGLLRPSGDSAKVVDNPSSDHRLIPAPVVGVAELTVAEWLTATDEERERRADLFVESPAASDTSTAYESEGQGVAVRRVTPVRGRRLEDGYWSVTLAVDLLQPPESEGDPSADAGGISADGAGPDAAEDAATEEPTRWYVEVGIVADDNGGYVALATPAVVPPPSTGTADWQVGGSRMPPEPDDPLATMIERFLGALLAGTGDAAPYLAPGTEITSAAPPLFAELTVEEMAVEELDETESWVIVHVIATTPDAVRLPLTYDLVVVERGDRWEIKEFSGVPNLIE